MQLFVAAAAALACVALAADDKSDLSHGFLPEIEWVSFEQSVGVAKDLDKPIFFLIHKTWCGACSGLKREFKTSSKQKELIELSKKFVMVNVEDDEEPEDSKYAPDGGYIPRILFLDTSADPMSTNNAGKYKNNKYFYPLLPQIIDGMKRALDEYETVKKTAKPATEEKEETNKVEEEEDKEEEPVEEKEEKEEKEEEKEQKDEL